MDQKTNRMYQWTVYSLFDKETEIMYVWPIENRNSHKWFLKM
jgi:hypothetical protein